MEASWGELLRKRYGTWSRKGTACSKTCKRPRVAAAESEGEPGRVTGLWSPSEGFCTSLHLLNTYCLPGTIPGIFTSIFHLFFLSVLMEWFFKILVLEMRRLRGLVRWNILPKLLLFLNGGVEILESQSSNFHFHWVSRVQSPRKMVILNSQARIWTTQSVLSVCSFWTKDFGYCLKTSISPHYPLRTAWCCLFLASVSTWVEDKKAMETLK